MGIKDKLVKALGQVTETKEINLEFSEREEFGDYCSNVALVLAKQRKKTPQGLAEEIAAAFNKNANLPAEASAIAGFVNFRLKKDILIDNLIQIYREKKKTGHGTFLEGQKISVEYTDPNPFKEFHIGHLYSNTIGESIAKILEASGAKVWRADFYGDVGMHVAKSVWGLIQKMKEEKVTLSDLQKRSLQERQSFMGKGYAYGVVKYDEDLRVKAEIDEINYLIYFTAQKLLVKKHNFKPIIKYQEREPDGVKLNLVSEVYEAGLNWSLDYFEAYYRRLGTKFDGYYPESWVGEYGMQIVEKGIKKGILTKSQGAVVFEGEKYGLHTRVFVNKLGLPTYEAKDLGLAYAKYQDFKYDRSINIFGKEIDEYYQVVRAAMRLIEPQLGEKAEYIAHGMVKLPEGKMASRRGNVITAEWLLAEVKKRLQERYPMPEEIAEKVAQGAVKYAFLKSSIGQDIAFSFDESISLEGNSGPYLQYTFARTQSVLAKVKNQKKAVNNAKLVLNTEETRLLRSLFRFPETIATAAKTYSPNLLCNYLYDLAKDFNGFYNQYRILKSDNVDFRLLLTTGVGQVLKNGLNLLGIQAPEKM